MTALALSLLAVAPAIAAPIIAGQEEPGFPAVVALGMEHSDGVETLCTGHLITPRLVLTAAHCENDESWDWMVDEAMVVFGADVESPDGTLGIEDYAVHPSYEEWGDDWGEYDAAIIVLDDDAPVVAGYVSLERLSNRDLGRVVKSVGFGVRDAVTFMGDGSKRSADLTLDELQDQYMISYALEDYSVTCKGDSGGPAFIEHDGAWAQAGVHSGGDDACRDYGVSIQVSHISPWLVEELQHHHGTHDLCAINGWYDDDDCHAHCLEHDPACGDEGVGCACGRSSSPHPAAALLGLLTAGLLRRRRVESEE